MGSGAVSNIEWRAYGELQYGAGLRYEGGLEEWALLKEHLQQYGLKQFDSCVEIGSGEGRLSNALAQDFAHVNGLDVSPHRIERASKVPNADKITFHLVDGASIPLPDGSMDLCISTHVLQHISSDKVIDRYFTEMFRVLRPGGCIVIHLPVIGAHGTTGELPELLRRTAKEMIKVVALPLTRGIIRLGLRKSLPWKIDYYKVFSFVKVKKLLVGLGFEDIELRLLAWGGGHGYVFARKPG